MIPLLLYLGYKHLSISSKRMWSIGLLKLKNSFPPTVGNTFKAKKTQQIVPQEESLLLNHPLWWSSPTWISLPPSNWPNIPFVPAYVSNTEEVNQTPLTVLVSTIDFDWNNLFSKYSSWRKLQ